MIELIMSGGVEAGGGPNYAAEKRAFENILKLMLKIGSKAFF